MMLMYSFMLSATICLMIRPGKNHWNLFSGLCHSVNAKGNLIPDAFLAALAIEHGCEFVSFDYDFSRFKKLKWSHPLK